MISVITSEPVSGACLTMDRDLHCKENLDWTFVVVYRSKRSCLSEVKRIRR
jgi:hypothetical protein